VQAKPSRQFPDAFDGIQIRAVGRQVAQGKLRFLFRPPRGVVVAGVINDHDHTPSGPPAALPQLGQKIPGRHPVKAAEFPAEEELAIPQADGSKIADAFAGGSVEQNGIIDLRRNPHPSTRTVLLKMNFVDRPEINGGILGQSAEFFYARLAFADQLEPPPGAACGSENPTGETAADIGEP